MLTQTGIILLFLVSLLLISKGAILYRFDFLTSTIVSCVMFVGPLVMIINKKIGAYLSFGLGLILVLISFGLLDARSLLEESIIYKKVLPTDADVYFTLGLSVLYMLVSGMFLARRSGTS